MFNVDLERAVLARALFDMRYLRKASPLCQRHQFSSFARGYIWKTIYGVYRQTGEQTGPDLMRARIEDELDEAKQESVLAEIETLAEVFQTECNPLSALEELRSFLEVSAAKEAMGGVIAGLDGSDAKLVAKSVVSGAQEISRLNIAEEVRPWGETWRERLSDRYLAAKDTEPFKWQTPFPGFNKATRGGPPAGKVCVLLANTNQGKSNLAARLGYTGLTTGPEAIVVHITSEDTVGDVEVRYDAIHTNIARDDLIEGRLSEGQIAHMVSRFEECPAIRDRLFIHRAPRHHDVGVIEPLLFEAREAFPKLPIWVVYDSPFNADGGGNVDRRFQLEQVFSTIDNWTKDTRLYPLTCWATYQAKAKFIGKRLTLGSAAEAHDVERIVDLVAGLTQLAGDAYELFISRNRFTKYKNYSVFLVGDTATCSYRQTGEGWEGNGAEDASAV